MFMKKKIIVFIKQDVIVIKTTESISYWVKTLNWMRLI